jgi:hypothetical protein
MKPWEIYMWKFPDAGEHPAVILGTVERVQQKPMINVLLCSSQQANRGPKETEVILDRADGLDWPTICKCDFVYSAPADQFSQARGSVTTARRREIAARVIRGLGLAGL